MTSRRGSLPKALRGKAATTRSGRGKKAAYRAVATFGKDVEVPVVIDGREVGRIGVKDILP